MSASGITQSTSNRLSDRVASQVESLLVDGEFRDANRLPGERELCERFGVSRTVVREALRTLEQRGVLEVQPGRGIFPTRTTSTSLHHDLEFMFRAREISFENLVEARLQLEIPIARLAASRRTERDLQRLALALKQMEDKQWWDVSAFLEADRSFHLELASASGNPILRVWISPIFNVLIATQALASLPAVRQRALSGHAKVLKAVEQSDCATAETAMHEHLQEFVENTRLAAEAGAIKRSDYSELKWLRGPGQDGV